MDIGNLLLDGKIGHWTVEVASLSQSTSKTNIGQDVTVNKSRIARSFTCIFYIRYRIINILDSQKHGVYLHYNANNPEK